VTGDEPSRQLQALVEERQKVFEELIHLTANVHEIRRIVGKPFCYSHPEHQDEGAANYTGGSSHEVILPTMLRLRHLDAEISRRRPK
jgi:hypothetical protein